MRKRFTLALSVLLVLILLVGCGGEKSEAGDSIILSTTTSTQDSGLLDYLLPKFEEETGIEVKVIAVGTGKALQMGKEGEADIMIIY